MSVFRRLRKCGERRNKETAVKYNGSLALAIARADDVHKKYLEQHVLRDELAVRSVRQAKYSPI